jgi:hypothetical protein
VFIGHIAVGLAARRIEPRVSLGWLIAAPVLLDLLWPIFLIAGLETVRIDVGNTVVTPLDLHGYPYTHSLVMAVVWSLVFAMAVRRFGVTTMGVCGALVFSHWVLDFVTHRPDMPLFPGSTTYVGLGLWDSLPGTVLVEGALFATGAFLYARATRAVDRAGTFAYASLVAFLCLVYGANLAGPPPPDASTVAYAALLQWLFIPWASYIDRHRTATAG